MAEPFTIAKDKRITYKTHISLFPITWRKMEAEAKRRGITGRELIQALLTQWGSSITPPPGAVAAPLTPPSEDEGYWLSLSSDRAEA